MDERLKFAVFIDYDNIEIGVKSTLNRPFDVDCVLEGLKERGEIVSKIAYGNWNRQKAITRAFTEHGVQMVQRDTTPRGDKNGADINLALDALEMAFTRDHINAFCIVSGDSDFMALVNKLKQFNKRVYIIGGKAFTSGILQRNCHEFISYESLYDSSPERSPRSSSSRGGRGGKRAAPPVDRAVLPVDRALPLINRALRSLEMRGSVPQMGLLKSTILQLDPAFNERNYGSSSFKSFIDKVADNGHLTVKVVEGHFVVERQIGDDDDAAGAGPGREDALGLLRKILLDNTELLTIGIPARELEAIVQAAEPDFDATEYGIQGFSELLNLARDEGYLKAEADRATGLRYFEGDDLDSGSEGEADETAEAEAEPPAKPVRKRSKRSSRGRRSSRSSRSEAGESKGEEEAAPAPKRRARRKRSPTSSSEAASGSESSDE